MQLTDSIITTAQLHSTKPELWFCTGSNPAGSMLEIRDVEDLWQWSRLEIRLTAILITKVQNKTSSNSYFKNLFNENDTEWVAIYVLPNLLSSTISSILQSVLYNIIHNILFLNKKLHIFGIKSSPQCSFGNLHHKAPFQYLLMWPY